MSSIAGWPISRSVQASPSLNPNRIILTHRQTQDLNQDDQFVRSTLLQWASSLKDLGFDGLRVDTVPEVKASFWAEFTQAAAVYTVGIHFTAMKRVSQPTCVAGEALNGDTSYVAQYQVAPRVIARVVLAIAS